jgi:hypothetical protein
MHTLDHQKNHPPQNAHFNPKSTDPMLFLPVNVQEDSRILPEQEINCQVLACFNPYSVKSNSVGTAWMISTGRFIDQHEKAGQVALAAGDLEVIVHQRVLHAGCPALPVEGS